MTLRGMCGTVQNPFSLETYIFYKFPKQKCGTVWKPTFLFILSMDNAHVLNLKPSLAPMHAQMYEAYVMNSVPSSVNV